eukprot:scaffold5479_cov199-Amphora_coffeaeformis.AAC.74
MAFLKAALRYSKRSKKEKVEVNSRIKKEVARNDKLNIQITDNTSCSLQDDSSLEKQIIKSDEEGVRIGSHATVKALIDDVHQHETHTSNSFDLVASNSCCSPAVRKIMGSTLMNSYCIGLPGERFYGGCHEIDTIEIKCRALACELFGAKYCEVQLLSGMMANIAAYNGVLDRMGCTVMASPPKHGGHYSHNVRGPLTRLFGANVVQTPWDENTYNVDLEVLPSAMETHRPVLLILGWSEMLFEHDLPAIRTICDKYGCKIMYDMSHVAGLVAGGVFQKDMMQYADIVSSSTGKSFHSADHGLILHNDPAWTPKIREAVMPLMTSNTHFHETAALYMTLLEMKEFGAAYASQVQSNTKALAKELARRKFKLLCPELGYSNTHEVIVDLEGLKGAEATKMLDSVGIFVNPQDLPQDTVESGATGLRLGTQVLTRRGFSEHDMACVAECIADVLHNHRDAATVGKQVVRKCASFEGVSYAFEQT